MSIIAWLALGLSVLSLWFQFGERARADIVVRLVAYPSTAGRPIRDTRVIFTNIGGAGARDVSATAIGTDGTETPLLRLLPDQPIPVIGPGHDFPVHAVLHYGGPPMANVTIKWNDRRPMRRSKTVTISLDALPA